MLSLEKHRQDPQLTRHIAVFGERLLVALVSRLKDDLNIIKNILAILGLVFLENFD